MSVTYRNLKLVTNYMHSLGIVALRYDLGLFEM